MHAGHQGAQKFIQTGRPRKSDSRINSPFGVLNSKSGASWPTERPISSAGVVVGEDVAEGDGDGDGDGLAAATVGMGVGSRVWKGRSVAAPSGRTLAPPATAESCGWGVAERGAPSGKVTAAAIRKAATATEGAIAMT